MDSLPLPRPAGTAGRDGGAAPPHVVPPGQGHGGTAPSRRELLPARAPAPERPGDGTTVVPIVYGVLVVWTSGDTEVHAGWSTVAEAEVHSARLRGLAHSAVIPIHLINRAAGP
ncbi:hypothetical protein FF36_01898 [Frankia torreyi]|uniref:Uncharacterized protein n=1 Tax=Frankia torreyi TaxID=1856 RepID=A0A0D8BHJ3_9ACTN|nr:MULTISPECIES: hypothetical protein [Frankia]KJE23713.1 hypothetical protein FF36_01898 [Frankia torreyi]